MNNVVELLFEKGNLCFQKFFFSTFSLQKENWKKTKQDWFHNHLPVICNFILSLKDLHNEKFSFRFIANVLDIILYVSFLSYVDRKVFIYAPEETFLPNFFILDSS